MSISYQRLWKTMSERGFTKTLLAQKTGIDLTTIDYLSRNKNVTTDVIDKIGLALDCDVDKILEIVHSDGNMASKPYSVVSLFSGCGGLDLGFIGGFTFLGKEYKENPYEIIWANDFNKAACETYRANIDEKIITGPVEESFDTLPINADVVIGGFPCQDISINGKMAGVDGKRSGLYIWISNPSASYLSGYLDHNDTIPNISIDTVVKAVGAIENIMKSESKTYKKELIIK